ncbi:hypothetical protein CAPTEDRAFT_148455 [Capitella teleta]|uniref:E3 UFM1-protein ligase 1 homolog n=1 Tax=Capitella teleta TaxID=283909 RepID=R7UII4_CAPTE|nr:hypothetical protein CAPTEDRAFT_148455 [Capitella teleta]|eukprot:ELU03598.1 hypothetical protein CAPTEDRAFT_148455 [Capitella teleta]
MADWEEIKRLAADFQRAQLSTSVQRLLSERNCIEIVQHLQKLNLINVVYTIDGREYLTPHELHKEILEELAVHGGKINVVELQQLLNVDLHHIETVVTQIVKSQQNLNLVLGQLIDKSYLDNLAESINDQLQKNGQLFISELTKAYDLPSDFLSDAIFARLGKIIKGQVDAQDRNIIFTRAFVARRQAKIRGALSALTKPVTLMSIMNSLNIQENMFFGILDELIKSKRLAGTIVGGHHERSQYVPDIYTRSQNEYVDCFYKQNGYLEYDALSRLGITDCKSYIQKRLKGEPLLMLSSCCIGKAIRESIEAEVDEALSTASWVDIVHLLPSICDDADAAKLLSTIMKTKNNAHVLCETIAVSESFISSSKQPFDSLLSSKAKHVAVSDPAAFNPATSTKKEDAMEERKEQRRKKAAGGGKGGGGTQGREGKTKSTKKKGGRGRDQDEDDDDEASAPKGKVVDMEFMSIELLADELKKVDKFSECPDSMLEEISAKLYRPLNKEFTEMAKSIFLESQGSGTSAARKKTHSQLSDKIVGLWTNAKLFEKGLKLFPDEAQVALSKHLLHTVCSDIANLMLNSVAMDNMISVQDESSITAAIRQKLLNRLPDSKTKDYLTKLNLSLTGKAESLEDFFEQMEVLCGSEHLEIALKKVDKKKERQLSFGHRQALAEQLRAEGDLALGLHLACVILLQVFTGAMVHAPGRCVPHLVALLKKHVTEEQHALLIRAQEAVIKQMKQSEGSVEKEEVKVEAKEEVKEEAKEEGEEEAKEEGEGEEVVGQQEDLLPIIKDLALNARKSNNNQD